MAAVHNDPLRPGHQPLPQRRQDYTNVAAAVLAESPGKLLLWEVGFFFVNVELNMELWTVSSGMSGFDDLWPIDPPD